MDYTTILAASATMTAPLMIQTIVKYAKEAGMPVKFSPLLAMVLGILIAVPAAITADLQWYYGISAGIPLGLVACGGYSAAKDSSTDVSVDTTTTTTV